MVEMNGHNNVPTNISEIKPVDIAVRIDQLAGLMRDMSKCGPEQKALVESVVENIFTSMTAKPEHVEAVEAYRRVGNQHNI